MSRVPVVRVPDGRFAPGSTGNPHGRPKGSMNHSTKLAARRAAAHADRLVTRLLQVIETEKNGFVVIAAIRMLLELGSRAEPERQDGSSTQFMTVRELRVLDRILRRARRRRERGIVPGSPEDQPDDSFTLATLPPAESAVPAGEPARAPEGDELVVDAKGGE